MQIWIDIEDASGTKLGAGPITTAVQWTSTRRLDAAGTFSFVMPASDPRALELQHKRIARCWSSDGTTIVERGAGIIDRISIQPQPKGPTMLEVSGDDLLRELANRTVGDLELFEAVAYTPTLRLYPGATTITIPGWVNLNPDNLVFIRYDRPFSKITFNLTTFNTVESSTLQIQYYNNRDPQNPAWEAVAGLTNTTNTGSGEHIIPFGQDGYIEFDPPSGWSFDDGAYTIRIFDQTAEIDQFYVQSCTVTIVEPVDDGLQRIMALAPPGWSLDPAGEFATTDPVYMQFAGESVLAALVKLSEQIGEHFTLSPSARRVWWIGTSQESSGLRAVQAKELADSTMLIANLSRTSDSYELYTRAYAYGGGIGSGRLTLEKTTQSRAGYTLNTTSNYLECDAAVAIYGRIDKREDYPDIAPVDASNAQIVNAANSLFDRVYNALRRKSTLQYAYDLSVVPSTYQIWPGQKLRVVYDEWVDGYHALAINLDLWVLEVNQVIDASGIYVADLIVATVDYWPNNDYQAVANLMGNVETQRSVDLPATGYTSISAGNPVSIDVQNGQVVSVGRVVPLSDGIYPPNPSTDTLKWFKLRSGMMIELGWDTAP